MLVLDRSAGHDAGTRERLATSSGDNSEGRDPVTQAHVAADQDRRTGSTAAHVIPCARRNVSVIV
jgi:hypothetical protein